MVRSPFGSGWYGRAIVARAGAIAGSWIGIPGTNVGTSRSAAISHHHSLPIAGAIAGSWIDIPGLDVGHLCSADIHHHGGSAPLSQQNSIPRCQWRYFMVGLGFVVHVVQGSRRQLRLQELAQEGLKLSWCER